MSFDEGLLMSGIRGSFGVQESHHLSALSRHSQLGTVLYLLGALLMTAGSFYAFQTAPEIIMERLVLGVLSTLFFVYGLLGMVLSRNFSFS